jgi:uncharacterized membrane protein YagU involved in acid resistance
LIRSPMIAGAVAGAVATAPMTIAMEAMHERLPAPERYPLPPAEIVEQVSGEPVGPDAMGQGQGAAASLALHFAVGAAGGAIYGPLAARFQPDPIVGGMAFGLAVWTTGYLGILPAFGILRPATEHPPRRNALMIAAHLVWGSALGLLVDRQVVRDKKNVARIVPVEHQ